jgi:hypothetical protein
MMLFEVLRVYNIGADGKMLINEQIKHFQDYNICVMRPESKPTEILFRISNNAGNIQIGHLSHMSLGYCRSMTLPVVMVRGAMLRRPRFISWSGGRLF